MNDNLHEPELSYFLEKRDVIEFYLVLHFNETHIKSECKIKSIGECTYVTDFLKCEKGIFSGDLK